MTTSSSPTPVSLRLATKDDSDLAEKEIGAEGSPAPVLAVGFRIPAMLPKPSLLAGSSKHHRVCQKYASFYWRFFN
jgi:hypothetical protein